MTKPWWLAVLRLTGLLAGVGLATSRVGLVVHEMVGHGGTAVAFGGEITEFRLFWFAGGWIRYDFSEPTSGALLAISLGGIVIEAVIGLALWWIPRRREDLASRLLRGVGAALVLHGAWYFATGTWHGYGDGLLAYRALGDARYPVAIGAGLVACAAAYAGARLVFGALLQVLFGSTRARVAGLLLAVGLAGGLQIALSLGEISIRGDATYGAIMRPERERVIARELAAWQREQTSHGMSISDAEREAEARRLAARHTEPPFMPALLVLLVVSVVVGAARSRTAAEVALTDRLLVRVCAIAIGSIGAVIAIDTLFH